MTYSSEIQWIDNRPDIPPLQGTDGVIKYQSTGPFRISLTNAETPGKSMIDGGSQGTERAAKSARYATTNNKNGTVTESVRDPGVVFSSLAFYVYTSRDVTSLPAEKKEDEDPNAASGPIIDVGVRFSGDDQAKLSFKISDSFLKTIKEEDLLQKYLQEGKSRPETLEELTLALLIETASIGWQADLTDYTVDLLTSLAANKPIYARGSLERYSANSVTIDIQEFKVGQIPCEKYPANNRTSCRSVC